MRYRVVGFVCLLCFASLGVVAQNMQRDQPSAKSQDRIVREVRHELLMLPYFGVFDYIAFKVDGGNVALLGQVVRPSLKSDAENAVKRIEGVDRSTTRLKCCRLLPWMMACASSCFARSMAILRWKDIRLECKSRFALS